MGTLDFYNKNAIQFTQKNFNIDMSEIQNQFLSHLKPGASILDFGCGSGRDIKYFQDHGLKVTGVDGSIELAKIAKNLTGNDIIVSDFRDFKTQERFDGIWACASLLHFPLPEMEKLLHKLISFLKPGGILYFSLRKGDFEGNLDGRYFKYLTQDELLSLLQKLETETLKVWETSDKRKDKDYIWFNILVRKTNE